MPWPATCPRHRVQITSVSPCRWSLTAALKGAQRVSVLLYRTRLAKGYVDSMAGLPLHWAPLSHMSVSGTFPAFPSIKDWRGVTRSPCSHNLPPCPTPGRGTRFSEAKTHPISFFLTAFRLKQEARALSEMQAHHPWGRGGCCGGGGEPHV